MTLNHELVCGNYNNYPPMCLCSHRLTLYHNFNRQISSLLLVYIAATMHMSVYDDVLERIIRCASMRGTTWKCGYTQERIIKRMTQHSYLLFFHSFSTRFSLCTSIRKFINSTKFEDCMRELLVHQYARK